jgi:hypothetical protein
VVDTNTMIATESLEGLLHSEPAFLTRVRLRAQRRILWMRKLWSPELTETAQGLAITGGEVEGILTNPEELAASEISFYAQNEEAYHLSQQIQAADQRAFETESWQRLRRQIDLSELEIDLLMLIVAAECNPSLRRVYGYLHDDANLCYATPWLASCLFGWGPGMMVGSDSKLLRWRLAFPLEGVRSPWSINAPWGADPFVISWLGPGRGFDGNIRAALEFVRLTEDESRTCLYPDQLADMQSFVRAIGRGGLSSPSDRERPPVIIELIGPRGSGKRVLAAQFCAAYGTEMVAADAGPFVGADLPTLSESVIRAARMARLEDATLYWSEYEGTNPKCWKAASGYCDLMIFGGEAPLFNSNDMDGPRLIVRLPRLSRATRVGLWNQLTDEPPPAPVFDWMLSAGEIVNAARLAPAGAEVVIEGCRQMLYQTPGELFTPLIRPYTWEDIVLTASVRRHLAELEEQARLRRVVYEEWGFQRLCPLGQGITALFAGPSGTGKTMAAQVLAKSLDLELYRVDLAGVVNKYIGETEKRLRQVFDSCERANVLLFFDEADALFGQRTQVKDAHDRFANIEIDYLLQRMEQFDGIAILATNRKNDVDKAFLRRLRFIVDFLEPGPAERLAIWHHALLEYAPDGQPLLDQIDWDFLAGKLNMTGADIKSAALAAAFLARSEGSRIGMRHVLEAASREMAKHGVVLREGDWQAG